MNKSIFFLEMPIFSTVWNRRLPVFLLAFVFFWTVSSLYASFLSPPLVRHRQWHNERKKHSHYFSFPMICAFQGAERLSLCQTTPAQSSKDSSPLQNPNETQKQKRTRIRRTSAPAPELSATTSSQPNINERNGQFANRKPLKNIPNEVIHGSLKSTTPRGQHHRIATDNIQVDLKRTLDLQTQLQYARNGHAVLRQLLVSQNIDVSSKSNTAPSISSSSFEYLVQLRSKLMNHGKQYELSAWRQKILVASDHDPVQAKTMAASCHTVEACQEQLQRLLFRDRPDKQGKIRQHHRPVVSLPFLQFFNAWRVYPEVLVVAKALAQSAAILMDVPSVRLYQDAVFWKRQEDGPTPWHVDARMAPFDTSHMITFWIPLQPVQHSGLVFCSKSQADFALPYWNDVVGSSSVASATNSASSPWNNLEERYRGGGYGHTTNEYSCVDYMPLALGDVTVHSGWTLHCADASSPPFNGNGKTNHPTIEQNQTSRMALAITFVDARAPIRTDIDDISAKSDREDVWSYQDWIHEVPKGSCRWHHPFVPILWPPNRQVNGSHNND